MTMPRPLEIYRHFKGQCYQIICVAENTETGDKEVIYQALYAPYKMYARELSMFMGKVDTEKYPEAEQEYRFELLDSEGFIVHRGEPVPEPVVTSAPEPVIDNEDISDTVIEDVETEDIANNVIPDKLESNEPKGEIDPILLKFLDAETNEERIDILQTYKDSISPEILTPIELSIGMEPGDGSIQERFREIKNFLAMKQRYERNHR